MPRVRCLTIHADYQCRHAGECCRAGWPIPIEPALQEHLDLARRGGRLIIPVAPTASVGCTYYERSAVQAGGGCAIHTQLGADLKPPSCRHFPKVALLDARGVSLTLSHYCPTAASMLFRSDVSLGITDAPASFSETDDYEGLDATDVLPPLLRPGMLWDYEGYSSWEGHAVQLLADDEMTPEYALECLSRTAAAIEDWCPPDGKLADHVAHAFAARPRARTRVSGWGENRTVVNRYLAARLFASWVPYRSTRLSAVVADVAEAHRRLQDETARTDLLSAIRTTDLRIVHAGR